MMFIRTSISSSLEMGSVNEERLALFRKRVTECVPGRDAMQEPGLTCAAADG